MSESPAAPLPSVPPGAATQSRIPAGSIAAIVALAQVLIGQTATQALFEDTTTALLLMTSSGLLFAGGALLRTPRPANDQPRPRFGRGAGWLLLLLGVAGCFVVARDGQPWAPMSGSGPEFMVPLAGGFLLAVLLVLARLVNRWALPAALLAGVSHGINVLVGFGLASQFAWLAQAELRETALRCAEIVGIYALGAALWERAAIWPSQIGRVVSLVLLSAAFVSTLWWSFLTEQPLRGIAATFAILGLLSVPLLLLPRARRLQDKAVRTHLDLAKLGVLLAIALATTVGTDRLSWLVVPIVLAALACYDCALRWRAPRRGAVAS